MTNLHSSVIAANSPCLRPVRRYRLDTLSDDVNQISSYCVAKELGWRRTITGRTLPSHLVLLPRKDSFFTGVADLIQCVFCRGVLDGWDGGEADGIPEDQYLAYRHRRHLPHCPFVRGFDVHNIPGGDQDERQGAEDLRREDHQPENELRVRFRKLLCNMASFIIFSRLDLGVGLLASVHCLEASMVVV